MLLFVQIGTCFHEQTWTTEVIFQEALASKTVFFHIDCSRDATRFDEAPDIRTDVIRTFIKSGSVKQVAIPITSEPIEVTQELEQCIISAVKGHYTEEMPMVFITPFFGTMGTAVSEDALAKKLSELHMLSDVIMKCHQQFKQRPKCGFLSTGRLQYIVRVESPRFIEKRMLFTGAR